MTVFAHIYNRHEFHFLTEYFDIGQPDRECESCGAMMWYEERNDKYRKPLNPKFSICCMQGKVQLPPVKKPPATLEKLMSKSSAMSKLFMKNIRMYNNMFAFTSMGGKVDHSINNGQAPYVFRMSGQNLHYMGSLLPMPGNAPVFSQMYVYDTENEIRNRLSSVPG